MRPISLRYDIMDKLILERWYNKASIAAIAAEIGCHEATVFKRKIALRQQGKTPPRTNHNRQSPVDTLGHYHYDYKAYVEMDLEELHKEKFSFFSPEEFRGFLQTPNGQEYLRRATR
jgi:transposase-like protein